MAISKTHWLYRIICTSILTLSIFFVLSPFVYCETGNYYYYHVASFRNEQRAMDCARILNRAGAEVVYQNEDVTELGRWYRVYVGPFKIRADAESTINKLKKKGLINIAFIKKNSALINANFIDGSHKFEASSQFMATTNHSGQPSETAFSNDKNSSILSAANTQTAKTDELDSSAPISHRDRRIGPSKGKISFSLKHTYRKIDTELTDRKFITDNGATITTQKIPTDNSTKHDFPTEMHMDSLEIGYGFTDRLEIFANIGAAYDTLSSAGFLYGGGARINLFRWEDKKSNDYYSNLEVGYMGGQFKQKYRSTSGILWQKNPDWQELTASIEIGIVRPSAVFYGGGTFFYYREDTSRFLLDNFPTGIISARHEDELEQKNSLGAYAGIEYLLNECISLNLEGQVGYQKGLSLSVKYFF